jgi:hypothetical protein
VWVCNRFDFRHHHPDGSTDAFPDPAFYRLFHQAALAPPGGPYPPGPAAAAVVPNTRFERHYGRLRGGQWARGVVRPTGLGLRWAAADPASQREMGYPPPVGPRPSRPALASGRASGQ